MHDLSSKTVHRISGSVSAFSFEKKSWDQMPKTWFDVEVIQKILIAPRGSLGGFY